MLGLARALWGSVPGAFAARPSGLIYFPILFRLFGLDAARYQAFYLWVDAAVAWNFYRLLVEEGVARSQALLAALFAALYPNHDATHHWMTDSAAPFALAGVLWAVRGFRAAQRGGSRFRRWAAGFVYAFSVLLYESSALLALLPAVLDFSDLRTEGRRASAAGSEALRRNVAPVALLAGAVAFQRAVVPALLSLESHPMSLSPSHAWHVFEAGFEITFLNRLCDMLFRATVYAGRSFGTGDFLIFVCFALPLAAWSFSWRRRLGDPAPRLLTLTATFFVLGYVPYIFDAKYTPSIFDPTNRVNLTASLGGAAWWAWAAARLRASGRPQARSAGTAATCLLLCGFLLADQVSGTQWASAARTQDQILSALVPRLRSVQGPANVLLYGAPDRVGSGSVFESMYDFDGALRLRAGRTDFRGLVGSGRARFEKSQVVYSWYGSTSLPYRNLYAYDASRDLLVRVGDSRAGNDFLSGMRSP